MLGPLLRHVDETSGCIWVETTGTATVTLRARRDPAGGPAEGAGGEHVAEGRTFAVHGHHYALVVVDGLEPGSITPYAVHVDGETVWPPARGAGSDCPPPVIATLKPGKPLRLAYGSCRTSVSHDEQGNKTHGVDALRALALRMAGDGTVRWPDLVLFLGDQVYADETTDEMRAFIAARRDIDQPPGTELKDYEEYAHLYKLAWSDPMNRWLLSTLPSLMIFDDHDVRDDWNTSEAWREQMARTSWWHDRIVGGLASYWVYQHIGNLSPAERAEDPLWQKVAGAEDEVDLSADLDAFAEAADADPGHYRWSFARDIGDVRLVVADSRAARRLQDGKRSMLDDQEMAWLDGQLRGGFRHLLVGTSLPFLLPPGLHHLEAWDEAVAAGAWGRRLARFGERLRQGVDLEHWGAFQDGFQKVARMAVEVADGHRGPAPDTVTFLSGDVHHSYVSEVRRPPVRGRSRIVQAVCSPIRNPLPRYMRFATAFLSYGLAGPMGTLVARSAHVPEPPFRWDKLRGPWFDNSIATLEEQDDGLLLTWQTGVVHDGDHLHPRLETIAEVVIEPH